VFCDLIGETPELSNQVSIVEEAKCFPKNQPLADSHLHKVHCSIIHAETNARYSVERFYGSACS
jgi:hypothetical protein